MTNNSCGLRATNRPIAGASLGGSIDKLAYRVGTIISQRRERARRARRAGAWGS